jgi:hypothetical protein
MVKMLSKQQQQALDAIKAGTVTHENGLMRLLGFSRSATRTMINGLVSLGYVTEDAYGVLSFVDADLLAMGEAKSKQKPTEKKTVDVGVRREAPLIVESTPSGDDPFRDQFIGTVDVPSYRTPVGAKTWPTPESPKQEFHELVKRGLERLNQRLHCQSFRIDGIDEKAATLKGLAITLAKFDGGHLSAMLNSIANDYYLIAEAQHESIKNK